MSDIETLRAKLEHAKRTAEEWHRATGGTRHMAWIQVSDIDAILAHLSPPDLLHITQLQWVALGELADDLSRIVQEVSTRDGDVTARQHQRAEAVRAAVRALDPAKPAQQYAPRDLRGLVEQWRQKAVKAERWLELESSIAFRQCANELEAALAARKV